MLLQFIKIEMYRNSQKQIKKVQKKMLYRNKQSVTLENIKISLIS